MSWDVLILPASVNVTRMDEITDDTEFLPLAPLSEVLDRLRSLYPAIDLSDPTWGVLDEESYSIEFSIGPEDPCNSIMLYVRGSDGAIEPIRRLCAATGWRALDTTTGEMIDFSRDPARGLRQWREYRDQVIPNAPPAGVRVGGVRFDGTGSETVTPPRKPWWKFW